MTLKVQGIPGEGGA